MALEPDENRKISAALASEGIAAAAAAASAKAEPAKAATTQTNKKLLLLLAMKSRKTAAKALKPTAAATANLAKCPGFELKACCSSY
jgi:hypothetical protein